MALTDDAALLREEKLAKRAELIAEAKLEQQLVELQAKYDEIIPYVRHRQMCPGRIEDSHHACTCGLSTIRAKHREKQNELLQARH